jgi:hypothetical protein
MVGLHIPPSIPDQNEIDDAVTAPAEEGLVSDASDDAASTTRVEFIPAMFVGRDAESDADSTTAAFVENNDEFTQNYNCWMCNKFCSGQAKNQILNSITKNV